VTSSGFSFNDDFQHGFTNSLFASFSLGGIDRRGVAMACRLHPVVNPKRKV
jgi:hypothetical protein